MIDRKNRWMFLAGTSLLLAFLLLTGLINAMGMETAVSPPPHDIQLTTYDTSTLDTFGYGFNVAAWDISRLQSMGFNWMKVFNTPGERLPLNVLIRLDANASDLSNVNGFGNEIQSMVQASGAFIDAYEIGNEPNLDATYGWGYGSTNVPPNAVDYVTLLCEAYGRIKTHDPDAIVVSAGLAPTGRVAGNWEAHPGHNGLYQDEREFFKEFVAAGGGNCVDAVGYHPYGYSAVFDAAPDVGSGDPEQNCVNGFCFRGVEKLYELMQLNGLGSKKVWATEFGWIVDPPAECLNDLSWQGRQWQIVSEATQASNLAGSFEYATANWPWMGAMFVFNLNFNKNSLPTCEQMRYYAVQDRPAESALSNLEKVSGPTTGVLELSPLQVTQIITPGQQPYVYTTTVQLENTGSKVFTYTATAVSDTLTPTIISPTGSLSPGQQGVFEVVVTSNGRSAGIYSGTVPLSTTTFVDGAPVDIPVTLYIFDELHQLFMPMIQKSD
ncbi:MAG: hypothetical protein GY943_04190 [Chloroflexi bacterium]|nr:hypothetical protein [Chloroflexota bacterium]